MSIYLKLAEKLARLKDAKSKEAIIAIHLSSALEKPPVAESEVDAKLYYASSVVSIVNKVLSNINELEHIDIKGVSDKVYTLWLYQAMVSKNGLVSSDVGAVSEILHCYTTECMQYTETVSTIAIYIYRASEKESSDGESEAIDSY